MAPLKLDAHNAHPHALSAELFVGADPSLILSLVKPRRHTHPHPHTHTHCHTTHPQHTNSHITLTHRLLSHPHSHTIKASAPFILDSICGQFRSKNNQTHVKTPKPRLCLFLPSQSLNRRADSQLYHPHISSHVYIFILPCLSLIPYFCCFPPHTRAFSIVTLV